MPIDPAVLLGGRGISLPDPMQLAQQQMTLAQLAQMRDARAYEIEKRKREEAKALAFQQALPMLLQNRPVADLAAQFPEAGADLLATDERMRKNKSDTAKSEAEAQAKRVDMQQKAMRDISNVAAQEAKNPNNLSLSRVQSVAKFYGVELPQPEGQDVGGYLSMLGNAGYDTKDRESLAETARGHTLTADAAAAGQRNQASIAAADRAERARATTLLDARAKEKNKIDSAILEGSMTGQPQEINVNGKPVLAIYDKRNGTFYDANTRQPIQTGIAPKQPELPAAVIQQMAQNEVTLANIRKARELVAEHKSSLGLQNYAGDTLMQRYDQPGVEVRAMVGNIAGQKIHDRSGAAVTIGEMQRLKPYIPNVTDTPETVDKKLALFEKEYAQIQDELAKGRTLAQMVNERGTAPTAGNSKLKPNADGSFDYVPGR